MSFIIFKFYIVLQIKNYFTYESKKCSICNNDKFKLNVKSYFGKR